MLDVFLSLGALIGTNGVVNEIKLKLRSAIKFQYKEDDLEEEIPQRIQTVIMKTKLVKTNTHATSDINKYKLS